MCTKVIGFGVRKSPQTRRVTFFIRRVVGGKDHRLTIGSHQQLSVRQARNLAMLKISEIELGVVAQQPSPLDFGRPSAKKPKAAGLTLGELWERVKPGWLAGVKPKTRTNIEVLFNSRILPKWSSTPVTEIRNANLSAWYDSFRESAPQYGALATKKVIQLLKLGHEQELVESVPIFKIRYAASKKRTPLDRQALHTLVRALEDLLQDNRYHPYANAMIAIMNTGERASAGMQLHTREVDYENKSITKSRKFDQVKTIPISDYAVGFLQSIHPTGGGYFFPNKSDPTKPIEYGTLLSFLKKLCVKHDVLALDGSVPTIHSMRHTYATLLEEKGLPLSHIQRLLGHSSIRSTLRYVHGNGAAARQGANLIEATQVTPQRS